jgi:hypothetical protein
MRHPSPVEYNIEVKSTRINLFSVQHLGWAWARGVVPGFTWAGFWAQGGCFRVGFCLGLGSGVGGWKSRIVIQYDHSANSVQFVSIVGLETYYFPT